MDSGKRLETLKKGLGLAMDDIPWVPIYVQTHIFAIRAPYQWNPRQDKLILLSEISVK